MDKNILVYYSILNTGGAERSLIRLMNALSRDGNCITLLTNYSNGDAMCKLDSKITKVSLCRSNVGLEESGRNKIFIICRRISVTLERIISFCRILMKQNNYDLIILGSHGMRISTLRGILHYNKCVKFIRTDLAKCAGVAKRKNTILREKKYIDYYLCVSETTKKSFDKVFPALSDKSYVIYNFLDVSEMKRCLLNATNPYCSDNRFHIATVCRISDKSKGVFRMLDVCKLLVDDGYNIVWYIVGDGEDLPVLREKIKSMELQDVVITVGQKDNPFGYYKHADLVAVLSYYEGLCGTVNEAKVSGAAVIATEFSGIHEQLKSGVNGWIVENNTDAIYNGMKFLLEHRDVLDRITNNIYPDEIIDDNYKLHKLYRLLNWM